jgi:hypothetical protein
MSKFPKHGCKQFFSPRAGYRRRVTMLSHLPRIRRTTLCCPCSKTCLQETTGLYPDMAGQLKAGSNSVPDWTITSVFFPFVLVLKGQYIRVFCSVLFCF